MYIDNDYLVIEQKDKAKTDKKISVRNFCGLLGLNKIKKEIEINFNEAMTGGRVKLMAGNEEVLNLARIGDEIVINQGTESEMRFVYAPKIKLDVSEGNYSLSV